MNHSVLSVAFSEETKGGRERERNRAEIMER
jgi:hypothetical protein